MELREYIEKCETGELKLSRLLEDVKGGRVDAQGIFDHYRRENIGRLQKAIALFGEGNLFKAQRQGFQTWTEGNDWASDYDRALEYRAVRDLCGERPSPIDGFIGFIVLPNRAARKRWVEEVGESKAGAVWSAIRRTNGWLFNGGWE